MIETTLKHTPLSGLHTELGATMVPFAGYQMPVRYAPGIINEHLHTRSAAGLFDVSHMGTIHIERTTNQKEGNKADLLKMSDSQVGLPTSLHTTTTTTTTA